jgi:hypothetical protein
MAAQNSVHGGILSSLEKPSRQLQIDFDEFYSQRVNNFEKERSIFNYYFTLIQPKKNDTYSLEWENRKLLEETRLSELEYSQIDEKIAKVRQEVDAIKQQIFTEDNNKSFRRQQISRLEELSRPVEHDVTYIIPDRFAEYYSHIPTQNSNQEGEHDKKFRNRSMTGKLKKSPASGQKQSSSPPKTSFAESSSPSTTLRIPPYKAMKTGEVIQLEGRLHDETIRLSSYLQDVQILIRTAVENRYLKTVHYLEAQRSTIDYAKELWEEHESLDFQCFYSVAELLKLRFRILLAQREEIETLERLQMERDEYQYKEESLKQEILQEMSMLKRQMQEEMQTMINDFQQQLIHLQNDKQRSYQEKKFYLQSVHETSHQEQKLKEYLQLLQGQYHKLKSRYNLDRAGYHTEILLLQKKLDILEKKLQKEQLLSEKRQQEEHWLQDIQDQVAARIIQEEGEGDDGEHLNTTEETMSSPENHQQQQQQHSQFLMNTMFLKPNNIDSRLQHEQEVWKHQQRRTKETLKDLQDKLTVKVLLNEEIAATEKNNKKKKMMKKNTKKLNVQEQEAQPWKLKKKYGMQFPNRQKSLSSTSV